MVSYLGRVSDGSRHSISSWDWMDTHVCEIEGWASIAPGTLNARLGDYRGYASSRRADFAVPRSLSNRAAWNCEMQRCVVAANGKSVSALIATTDHNYWGKTAETIEIRAQVNLRNILGVSTGDEITVTIAD